MDRSLRMALAVLLMWVLGMPAVLEAQPRLGTLSGPVSEDLTGQFASQEVASLFFNLAQGLTFDPNLSESQADLALVWLEIALECQQEPLDLLPVLLDVVTRFSPRDCTTLMLKAIRQTPLERRNIGLLRSALRYLLTTIPSALERQRLLETLIDEMGGVQDELDAEFAFLMGLLTDQAGRSSEAQAYFMKAYRLDQTNSAAFEKLSKLVPDKISASMFLTHLRTGIQVAPLNLDNALEFALYAERLELYSVAVGAYRYCADLFHYLYPDRLLPALIYLPWAMSVYNEGQDLTQIMEIAQRVRQGDRFDIFLEALVGKVADKTGHHEEADEIFRQTAKKGRLLMDQGVDKDPDSIHEIGRKQLAWFYNFALRDRGLAMEWANEARAEDPNSEVAMALSAYSLVMENQPETIDYAAALIERVGDNQIAEIVRARIALREGRKQEAMTHLRRCIAKDPGSLVAEEAKQLLAEQSVLYHPVFKPEELLADWPRLFGDQILPQFMVPEKAIVLRVDSPVQALPYTEDIQIRVSLANPLQQALRIGKGGLVEGWIRVDAQVSGDLQQAFPRLVEKRLFIDQWLPAGDSTSGSINLNYSDLGRWLSRYPQADLKIHLTVTLDPVEVQGGVRGRLTDLEPAQLMILRPKVNISPQWIQDQYYAIVSGTLQRKIEIARWFSGLLKEIQMVQALGDPPYPMKVASWLPKHLKMGLAGEGNLLDSERDQWPVRVCVTASLEGLTLDSQLSEALAKNLQYPYWPVRLVTLYILSQAHGEGFKSVLEWAATRDKHARVRAMAKILQTQ